MTALEEISSVAITSSIPIEASPRNLRKVAKGWRAGRNSVTHQASLTQASTDMVTSLLKTTNTVPCLQQILAIVQDTLIASTNNRPQSHHLVANTPKNNNQYIIFHNHPTTTSHHLSLTTPPPHHLHTHQPRPLLPPSRTPNLHTRS